MAFCSAGVDSLTLWHPTALCPTRREAANRDRVGCEEADLRLSQVRPVRTALHRADVSDELAEAAPERPVRRRPERRGLRGEVRDAVGHLVLAKLGQGA